jgi:hypothetical protein
VTWATELGAWEAWGATNPWLFAGLEPGFRLALVASDDVVAAPGRGLVCEFDGRRARARTIEFGSLTSVPAEVLFVAASQVLERILAAPATESGSLFRGLLRRGEVRFYSLLTLGRLEERGFGEVLDRLGLAYLGGCGL